MVLRMMFPLGSLNLAQDIGRGRMSDGRNHAAMMPNLRAVARINTTTIIVPITTIFTPRSKLFLWVVYAVLRLAKHQ